MNKGQSLDEGDVVRAAVALKGLREFKDKSLEELIDTACSLMLYSRERIRIAEQEYERRKSEEVADSNQAIPFIEAAKMVTKHVKIERALDMFCRFIEYLSAPDNGLLPKEDHSNFLIKLENQDGDSYPKGFCEELMELYPRWWAVQQSQLQAEKAQKRFQKKPKKSS